MVFNPFGSMHTVAGVARRGGRYPAFDWGSQDGLILVGGSFVTSHHCESGVP